MKLAIGSDHAGFPLKESLAGWLRETGADFQDVGTHSAASVDYPDIAARVCQLVVEGQAERGILVCGSGIGMSIAANKIHGIRAAQVSEPVSARLSRLHNDANVLTMSGRLIGPEMGKEIVQAWLATEFEGGRHQRRIDQISDLEGPAVRSNTAMGAAKSEG